MKDAAGFPTLLETFFTRRLIAQRRASPHTIASYRDSSVCYCSLPKSG
jgi:integrase/recombinase XerD